MFYFLWVENRLATQCGGERDQLTPRRSNKNERLFNLNVVSYLPLLRKVQTKCNSSEEKQVIIILRAGVVHHTRQHLVNPGKVRSQRQLLN